MLLIPTRVAPSRIHGQGLFAVSAIPRHTPVWKFQPAFDRTFSPEAFAALPDPAQRHLRWFAYLDPQNHHWVLSGDHACFMNHAAQPNTGTLVDANSTVPVVTVALRDIAAGEELTCNYFAFDAEAKKKVGT
jgi:SET domain-containing protein